MLRRRTRLCIYVCVYIYIYIYIHTYTQIYVQLGAEEHPQAFWVGSSLSRNHHFDRLYQSRRIVALYIFTQLKCSFITPNKCNFYIQYTYSLTSPLHVSASFTPSSENCASRLATEYTSITAVLHCSYSWCRTWGSQTVMKIMYVRMYFAYNIETVNDRACYVTSFKYCNEH
jgi:hypothetical protein